MPRCPQCHRRLESAVSCPADGQHAPVVPARRVAAAPAQVGGYQLGRVLGSGGFSTVFEADSDATHAAVKLAHGSSADVRARFAREAHALSRIGAPHVPELLQHGALDDGRAFLVMEHVRGPTLAQMLARATEPFALDALVPLADRLLQSLATVHSCGFVHRDLKPENVIVPDEGPVRLLDFGLVSGAIQRDDASLTRTGTLVGTWEYMAPEQLRGSDVAVAADVYAFGLVLFELLTLRLPFVGDRLSLEHGHLAMRPPAPSRFRPVPASLERLVLACLAKAADARPTVAALRDDLGSLLTSRASGAEMPARSRPVQTALGADAQRPVALVYVAGALPVHELQELAARHRALIARSRGSEVVLALLGTDHDHPLQAAVELAHEAVTHPGIRAAVHVGRALVRRLARGQLTVFGRDVEQARGWLPASPWDGVVLTSQAAALSGTGAIREPSPLVGRTREIEHAVAVVTGSLRDARPAICVVAGEEGIGKTAVAAHVCTEVARAIPDVQVVRLACRRPLVSGGLRDDALHAAVADARHRASERRLVVFVDDAHFADEETVELIERSCTSASVSLTWIVTCTPMFLASRPAWRRGDGHVDALTLAPLDDDSAATLAAQLLPAGTTVSREILLKLARWAGGNPSSLQDLIDVLRRENIVRRHEGTRAWFVASDELDRLPSSPVIEWLAARELASLAPEIADCARICAVIGQELAVEELEAAFRHLEHAGLERPLVDPWVGLSHLVERGLISVRQKRFAFRRASLQEGLYALCSPALQRAVHDAIYRYWTERDDAADVDRVVRIAHHGARADHRDDARACYLELATRAKATHAYSEAERMLTAALDLCPSDDESLRFRILVERGSVRRVLTRYEEARSDFAAARTLAERSQDRVALVSVLVEEAAVCDFTDEWDAQAKLVAKAEELAAGGLPEPIDARYRNWLGVSRARQGRLDEAIELLESAAVLGATIGEHETEVGSLLLLGFLLVSRGERARGKAMLDEAIDKSEQRADKYHLAIGLLNRIGYWDKEGPWERAEQDCRRAIAIAREMGFHQLALYGLHSLSIGRWWRGDLTGAVDAARQAYELSMERFGEKSGHNGRLQYAYLLAFEGRTTEARALLAYIREDELKGSPANLFYLRALHFAVDGGAESSWQETLAGLREHGEQRDLIEILWLRARSAARSGERTVALEALELAYAEAERCAAPIASLLLAEKRSFTA